jgi:hypothetical protein
MTRKKHVVDLSEDERTELESFVSSGIHRAEDITKARILLKADGGATDAKISRALECGESTPYRACPRNIGELNPILWKPSYITQILSS